MFIRTKRLFLEATNHGSFKNGPPATTACEAANLRYAKALYHSIRLVCQSKKNTSSKSYLSAGGLARTAVFYGNLDITALGGAGFASQRTATNTEIWNLAEFDGLLLDVENADGQYERNPMEFTSRVLRCISVDLRYTFILKDTLLPPNPDTGREQSTISYEYDFSISEQIDSSKRLYIPWSAFRATYRGRDMPDAPPVNLSSIRRFSFMVRRFVV